MPGSNHSPAKPPGSPCGDSNAPSPRQSLSMHDGVEDWEDCCSCEAEPYWREAFADSETEAAEK